MNRQYDVKSDQTIEIITDLHNRGITRMAAVIRHSHRFYATDARKEPFMGLTPKGRQLAFDMGSQMALTPAPRLFSSPFGRCIETAYLIDKGFTHTHRAELPHNTPDEFLAPFYIKDIPAAVGMVEKQGSPKFIRDWFDRKIDGKIIEDPGKTADILAGFATDRITELADHRVALCITHDWNIFPLKQFKLGLPHEVSGVVDYLDGVVIYEENHDFFITGHGADAKPL